LTAHAELRELARGIHPAALTRNGVVSALRGLAQRFPLPVEVEDRAGARFPDAVEAALYYVAAEALTNAARHAAASRVQIRVAARDGAVELVVEDDGRGGADPEGSGLRGLRDRVEALSGELTLTSAPGAGTRLHAAIPAAHARLDGRDTR
jgi:signal transduction histidine kinase